MSVISLKCCNDFKARLTTFVAILKIWICLLNISCLVDIVLVSMVESSGSLTAIVFVILRFHGVKVCEKYGIYFTILTDFLLMLLGQCLPIFDEICKRSSNLIHSCIVHKSILIPSVALYGILFFRILAVFLKVGAHTPITRPQHSPPTSFPSSPHHKLGVSQ